MSASGGLPTPGSYVNQTGVLGGYDMRKLVLWTIFTREGPALCGVAREVVYIRSMGKISANFIAPDFYSVHRTLEADTNIR